MKHALIDIGSNSIRLTVYEVTENECHSLFRKKIMAGLAGYVENGNLSEEGIACACRSLNVFRDILTKLEIEHLAVFATASLRNIFNTDEVVHRIKDETGLDVDVISGESEAEYGFYGAIRESLSDDGLIVDIGGASTELVLFRNRVIEKAGSLPVGSLKLYRDCVKKILPGKGSVKRILKETEKAFESSDLNYVTDQKHMMGVGGTNRAVLHLIQAVNHMDEDENTYTCEQLYELADILCNDEKKAASLILKHEPERIHTIVPGMMILCYIVKKFGVETVTVSSHGVREGYMYRCIQPLLGNDRINEE